MKFFCGRPLRALLLPMALLAARGLSQDVLRQDVSVPLQSDDSVSPSGKPAAADSDPVKADQEKSPQSNGVIEAPPDKRVLGVLPNYRTVNETGVYTAITAKQKLTIASKDSFDYPLVLLGGAFAGISQLTNSDPSYGQGVEGYAKRLAANYADQAIGNMMTEGFFPVLLHEDPRYRRLGASRGTKKYRVWYAATRVFVTRTDSGGARFNYSEWLGNSTGVAISNLYHPDERNWSDNATKLLTQCGTDALSQVLKEFWPDIKQRLFHKKSSSSD